MHIVVSLRAEPLHPCARYTIAAEPSNVVSHGICKATYNDFFSIAMSGPEYSHFTLVHTCPIEFSFDNKGLQERAYLRRITIPTPNPDYSAYPVFMGFEDFRHRSTMRLYDSTDVGSGVTHK